MSRKLFKEEWGTALSEYLILLGTLCGGLLLAMTLAAAHISGAYGSWSTFYSGIGRAAGGSGIGGDSSTSTGDITGSTGSGGSSGGSGNNGNGQGAGSANAHGGNPNANPNAGGKG